MDNLPDPTPWLIGLAAVITAAGTAVAQFNKAAARASRRTRRALRVEHRRGEVALLYIHELRRGYVERGEVPPSLPPELEADYDAREDDEGE